MPSFGSAGRPRLHELYVEALSREDWNYIRGLFFADGAAFISLDKHGWRRYRVLFFLQGNETEIVERLVLMLRTVGMNPHVILPRDKYSIVVEIVSKALFGFLPDRNALKQDAGAQERFFSEHRLRELHEGIPFVSGLIDGDGSARVHVKFRGVGNKRFRDVQEWSWNFAQRKYPFLICYLKEFIDSLTSDGSRLYEWSDGKRLLALTKSGTEALLGAGIAEFSWKAREWLRSVAEVRVKLGEFYTTNQVAEMFKVTVATVNNWLNAGKMSSKWGSDVNGKVSQRYIPRGEVEEFQRRCAETAEEIQSKGGMKLIDVARMLGLKEATLRSRYLKGKLRASLARELTGQVWRNLVIPREEVERLKEEKKKERREIA
jgi:transposase